MLEQCQSVGNDFVDVHVRELGTAGAREIQQVIYYPDARNVCRVIFSAAPISVSPQLFGKHLRVGRDHGERRIHLMSHARR